MRKWLLKRAEWVSEIEVDGAECHDRTDDTCRSPINCLISSHSVSDLLASMERPDDSPERDSDYGRESHSSMNSWAEFAAHSTWRQSVRLLSFAAGTSARMTL